jgi:hypothetical protein
MALPEPKYKNSAGHLHALLRDLKKGTPYVQAVPALFGDTFPKDENKNRVTLQGLAELQKLYLQFREDMASAQLTEDQRNVLLSGMAEVEALLYPLQLNAAYSGLGEAQAALLEMAAATLPQENAPTEDDIAAIRESIAALRTLVEGADISPTLRAILLDLIRISEDALARFRIYGARVLKRAYKLMLSEAMDAYATAAAEGRQEELKKGGAWDTVVNHLKTLDAVASRLMKYKALFAVASKWLLGPSQ